MSANPLLLRNFNILSVVITTADPENPSRKLSVQLDKSSVLQFEYREGIMNSFIQVTLQIADTTNQLTDVLVGMETVELVVQDNLTGVKYEFNQDSMNGPLYVYQIHDKIVSDNVKIVVLELCRKDALESAQQRICKKYNAIPAADLVREVLGGYLQTTKSFENVSPSLNKLSFIPPNSRPLDILVWARNKYVSKDQKTVASGGGYASAGYFFWETYNGYNFLSMDSIPKKDPLPYTYTTGRGLGAEDEVYLLNAPKFPKAVNMMQDFDRGFYSGTIDFFDTVNCEVYSESYNLKENFPKWNKVAENNELPQLYNEVLDNRPTRTMSVSFNDDLFLEPGSEKNTDSKMLFKETITQSVQRMGVFTNSILTASIYGNMAINAGEILNIEFLDSNGHLDNTYSGRYVIFDLTHLYSLKENKLNTQLTLVRDSFGA